MRQKTDLIEIDVNFEYTGTQYNDDLDLLNANILEYQAFFQNMDWTHEELEYIAKELVETGRIFAKEQGFGPQGGSSLLVTSPRKNKFGTVVDYNIEGIVPSPGITGNLYLSIKAEREGNQVRFYNDAMNSRGQPYAGHMEYGFHDRGGNFIPARPFMRPAFHAVSEASRGNFRSIMKGLLDNMWTTQGYNGINIMSFGRKRGSQSLFWKQNGDYGSKLSRMSRMKELSGDKYRKEMSASRFGEVKKGYRFAKNSIKRIGLRKSQYKQLKGYENDRQGRTKRSSKFERDRAKENRRLGKKEKSNHNIGRANAATDYSYRGGLKGSSRYNLDSSEMRKSGSSKSSRSSRSSSKKSKENSSKYLKDVYIIKGRNRNDVEKTSYLPIKDYLANYEVTTPSRSVSNKYGKNKVYLREKEK